VRVGILGAGAVGARAARQVAATDAVEQVLIADLVPAQAERVARAVSGKARAVSAADLLGVDAVILATPAPQTVFAETHLRAGSAVVSTSDDWEDVRSLLALRVLADARSRALVVGAAFAPGLSCLLARYASRDFDVVDEIHVAKHGTGGPSCARPHHRALTGIARGWHDGEWIERPAGSGRELCFFPEPIAGRDCYRAVLADPLLLRASFSDVARISARMSATRRDRFTAWLPMLRRPHPEGGLGAVRVEVRGERGGQRAVEVLGAIDRAGIAAGAVAAVAAIEVAAPGSHAGVLALADPALDTAALLRMLAHRGIKAARFGGGDML